MKKEKTNDFMTYVFEHIMNEIVNRHGVSPCLSAKLFINALSSNLVVSEILAQVEYLFENNIELIG